jgi:hypothetical protein
MMPWSWRQWAARTILLSFVICVMSAATAILGGTFAILWGAVGFLACVWALALTLAWAMRYAN